MRYDNTISYRYKQNYKTYIIMNLIYLYIILEFYTYTIILFETANKITVVVVPK